MAEQDQADEGEKEREDEAGHYVGSPVIASEAKQSILSFRGEMDCFASLAMTIIEKAARAALGGRVEPRALWKEEVGEASSFQSTSTQ